MSQYLVVHPRFDLWWSFAADHVGALWQQEVHRLAPDDTRPLGEVVPNPGDFRQLISLGVPVTPGCRAKFPQLQRAVFSSAKEAELFGAVGRYPLTEAFWGQSVAEYALGLTLAGLRRIPQTHGAIVRDLKEWDYRPPGGVGRPGQRSGQFGDDARFTNGTVAGKRVRICGLGNIGSRYATWTKMLGADVAAWDPVVPAEAFAQTGARRVASLAELVRDAEIFAPMMPLRDATRGIVTADLVRSLPAGGLVVLVTRAEICDMPTLRARVLADELSLAADVFDVEPLPLTDPLLGRANVVHTPHNAGRTIHANHRYAETLFELLNPEK